MRTDGFGHSLRSLLSEKDEGLQTAALGCITRLAMDPHASREFRTLGGIPLTLSLIK